MSYSTQAEAIRRLAVQYQDMVSAAEALEKIGAIENATAEAVRLRDAALLEVDSAKGQLIIAQDYATQTRAQAQAVLDSAEKRKAEIASAASAAAAEAIEVAKRDAKAITDRAAEAAEGIQDAQLVREQLMKSQLEKLEAEIADANERATAARADAVDAEAKLLQIRATIANITGAAK